MLAEALLTLVIIIITLLIKKCYISPKNQIERYKKMFQSKGYRVYCFPYKPLTYPIIQTIYKDSQKGDAFDTYKKVFSNYDVLIGNQLHKPSISLFHPELRKQFAKVERDFCMEKLKDFTKQQARFAGYGLIFSEGEDWKRKRKIMGSLFTHELLKQNVEAISQICKSKISETENISLIGNHQNTFQFNLGDLASKIFSEVIISIFLGLKTLNSQINGIPIGKFILELANDANMQAKGTLPLIFGIKYLDWGLTEKDRQINGRLRSFEKWIDDFIQSQIQAFKSNEEIGKSQNARKKDILALHLSKKSEQTKNNQTENSYQKDQLIAQLKNFAIAGTDTSVNFFRMMVYYIFQNPEVQQKLREQILTKIGDEPFSYQNLKELKYIQAIQKETMRMYGPTNHNFPRRVLKDYYLEQIPIKKQTIIQYHSIPTHYNSQYYENPFKFNPDRWLSKQNSQISSQALLVGFGLGPRNCIGQHLASLQSKIALVCFYQRFRYVGILNKTIGMKWKFLYKPDEFDVEVKIEGRA